MEKRLNTILDSSRDERERDELQEAHEERTGAGSLRTPRACSLNIMQKVSYSMSWSVSLKGAAFKKGLFIAVGQSLCHQL